MSRWFFLYVSLHEVWKYCILYFAIFSAKQNLFAKMSCHCFKNIMQWVSQSRRLHSSSNDWHRFFQSTLIFLVMFFECHCSVSHCNHLDRLDWDVLNLVWFYRDCLKNFQNDEVRKWRLKFLFIWMRCLKLFNIHSFSISEIFIVF